MGKRSNRAQARRRTYVDLCPGCNERPVEHVIAPPFPDLEALVSCSECWPELRDLVRRELGTAVSGCIGPCCQSAALS